MSVDVEIGSVYVDYACHGTKLTAKAVQVVAAFVLKLPPQGPQGAHAAIIGGGATKRNADIPAAL